MIVKVDVATDLYIKSYSESFLFVSPPGDRPASYITLLVFFSLYRQIHIQYCNYIKTYPVESFPFHNGKAYHSMVHCAEILTASRSKLQREALVAMAPSPSGCLSGQIFSIQSICTSDFLLVPLDSL